MKNKNINLDLKSLQPLVKKYLGTLTKHALFLSVIAVLLVYVFVVFRINELANAEPSDSDETTAQAKSTVPRVDKNAINQIQALEQNNTQVESLFEQARTNPFQE